MSMGRLTLPWPREKATVYLVCDGRLLTSVVHDETLCIPCNLQQDISPLRLKEGKI